MLGVNVGGAMKPAPGMSKRGTFGGSLGPFKFKAARKWFSSMLAGMLVGELTFASMLGGELTPARLFMFKTLCKFVMFVLKRGVMLFSQL